jgi:hypothetical protein
MANVSPIRSAVGKDGETTRGLVFSSRCVEGVVRGAYGDHGACIRIEPFSPD